MTVIDEPDLHDLQQHIDAALDGTTPGPWHWPGAHYAFIRNYDPRNEPGKGDYGIAAVLPSNECRWADARLIAAAPELLRKCRDALAEKDTEIRRLREALGEQRHIAEFRADGFGLQHPVECRPNLIDCPVSRELEALDESPVGAAFGHYVVTLDDDGTVHIGDRTDGA